jgi:hypothetical protein
MKSGGKTTMLKRDSHRQIQMILLTLLLALFAFGTALVPRPTAAGMSFVVINTNNSGAGSLRQAIIDANTNPGTDTITFNIPGAGVHTISPMSALPSIADPVIIDGTTQPGFAAAPIIELDGTNTGPVCALGIDAGNSTVKGLVINRFGGGGICLGTNGGNTISGNYIGTDATGAIASANASGVQVQSANNVIGGTTAAARNVISGNSSSGIVIAGAGVTGNLVEGNFIGTNAAGTAALGNGGAGVNISNAANNTIGGTTAGARNVISGNGDTGIVIGGPTASGTLVQGNYIGTDATGMSALSNVGGLFITGPNNVIGGTAAGARNVISGNNLNVGVTLSGSTATGNQIQGNYIGVRADGSGALGNHLGVSLDSSASNNSIGGTAANAGNIIANNIGAGVSLFGSAGSGNAILGNSIHDNTFTGNLGEVGLGIDLKADGVTPNDHCDVDTGPNDLQNFPVLTSATAGAVNTTIQGTLDSTANTQFRIEFFSNSACDPTGNGEGQTFLGATNVTTDGSCNASFQFVIPNASVVGSIITATATNPGNSTSEFSACITAVGLVAPTIKFSSANFSVNEGAGHATITVTRTGDTSGSSSVDYKTIDDPAPVRCDVINHTAYARCDYATTLDTLTFAPGETSKTFAIPIIDDSYAEGDETFQIALSNPVGASLGSPTTATVTINDNDVANGPNPILLTNPAGVSFFVRQHYLDFLAREPEMGEPWSAILNGCANQFNTDPSSPSAGCDRLTVSGSFFGSPEFLSKGVYTIVFYRVAFTRLPDYLEFAPDLRSVTGATAAETNAKRAAFANNFVLRTEFVNTYGAMSNSTYVTTLMGHYSLSSITTPDPANPDGGTKVTLTTNDLINGLNGSTLTRAQVLRAIVQSDQVSLNFEAVNAFVASQYYGYLRRTPDAGGFNSWVNYLSAHPSDFRTMVNGFMNSIEYRLRFGP